MSPLNRQSQLLAKAALAAIPIDVSLELTHHCNFRCKHCYIPDFQAPDRLTTERILELLEELAGMGTLALTLTGGELFLRRDWCTIAQRARELGFALRLFTNGFLVTGAVADLIAPLHATVEVSLYSMQREVFERITQRPGSFERTIQGIELLRACGIPVVLKMPMMRDNAGDVSEVRAYAETIGAECQSFPTLVPKKDGDLTPVALRIPQEELVSYYGGPSSGCHQPSDFDDDDPRRDGPLCAAASRFCSINSAGDVMACNILPGSGGNLLEHSFKEIWETSPWLQEVRSIRRRDLDPCNTCSRLSYCGRCHAQALMEDGDLYGPSRYAQQRAELIELVSLQSSSPTGKSPAT